MYENVQFEIAIFIHFKTAIDMILNPMARLFELLILNDVESITGICSPKNLIELFQAANR